MAHTPTAARAEIAEVAPFAESLAESVLVRLLPLIGAVLGFVVAWWAQSDSAVGIFFDDGIYVALAKSLAEGHGYRNVYLPGSPAAVHFPPLYPAVLSLLWISWPSFPANLQLMKLFDCLAFAVSIGVLAVIVRRWPMRFVTVFTAMLAAFCADPLVTLVMVRMAEPMFLALMAATLLVADGGADTDSSAAVAGVLGGLSALTRSIGVAVVFGVALAFWLRGRRRGSVIALGSAAIVLLPWLAWVQAQAGHIDPDIGAFYGTYGTAAAQAGGSTLSRIFDLQAFSPIPRLLLPALPDPAWYALAVALNALGVIGAIRVWPRARALVLSLAAYICIVTFWPFTPDRFMWVALPFTTVLMLAGATVVWKHGVLVRGALCGLGVVILAGFGARELSAYSSHRFQRVALANSEPIRTLTNLIAANTPSDAVVAVQGEAPTYLYTGRRAVPSWLFQWRLAPRAVRTWRASTNILFYMEPESTTSVAGFYCRAEVTHIAVASNQPAVQSMVDQLGQLGDSTATLVAGTMNGSRIYQYRCPNEVWHRQSPRTRAD